MKGFKDVTSTPDEAFYKDERPHKALSPNWKKYVKMVGKQKIAMRVMNNNTIRE